MSDTNTPPQPICPCGFKLPRSRDGWDTTHLTTCEQYKALFQGATPVPTGDYKRPGEVKFFPPDRTGDA